MEIVLNSFGASLSRDNGMFVVSFNGSKQKLPVKGIDSIQISKGAQITSDAVILAIENEIEILFVDKSGAPMGRVWSNKYGSISTIRKGQINFTFSKAAVDWIKDLMVQKMDNQLALIFALQLDNDVVRNSVDKAVSRISDYQQKVKSLNGDIISDIASTLRGWEGIASKIYFETLNLFVPDYLKFESRTQHPAMDVVNALLNYGYGLLYGKIEGKLIKAGIDPYVGVFHRDDYNRPVLVFDVIEKYRIWVDYVVFSLVMQNNITEEFYSVKSDGSYWLEGLGRRVLIQSMNDYLDEVILSNGISRSRETHIALYAQELAQYFKTFQ